MNVLQHFAYALFRSTVSPGTPYDGRGYRVRWVPSYKCETLTRAGPCSRELLEARATPTKPDRRSAMKRQKEPPVAGDHHENEALFPVPVLIFITLRHCALPFITIWVRSESETVHGIDEAQREGPMVSLFFPRGSTAFTKICINLRIKMAASRWTKRAPPWMANALQHLHIFQPHVSQFAYFSNIFSTKYIVR